MKQIVFLLLISLSLCGCFQPERNCLDFRTGTFEFQSVIDGQLVKTTFVRNDSIEIDYFKGKSDTSSIRWINDCEFIVKKLHPRNMAEEKAIHMKILTTDQNTYSFEYAEVGKSNKQKGTAKKIN